MLCRKAEQSGRVRAGLCVCIVAGCILLPIDSPARAQVALEQCWRQASTRIELQPCLRRLLEDAEERLAVSNADPLRRANELDRVTGDASSNLVRTLESDSRWREYRRSECMRRAQAMSPGTGSGDVLLACEIDLTNERIRHLDMP